MNYRPGGFRVTTEGKMMSNGYNGWTNYETWNIALWIDNEQGSQEYWAEIAQQRYLEAEEHDDSSKMRVARGQLAQMLKDAHEEALPELQGFAADLLNAAMSEVNWIEIAGNMLADHESLHEST